MLNFTQGRDFEKVVRSLPTLKPLLEAFKAKYGRDLDQEIRANAGQGRYDQTLLNVQQLVFYDMKDLMDVGLSRLGESTEQARSKLKAAYLDYLLLSPFVQVKNFGADQKIKKNFRSATIAVDTVSPYGGQKDLASGGSAEEREVRKLVEQIITDLSLALPELK
jgi:hypothetical protein